MKHRVNFDTQAEYEAAKDNLDLPNVSLVKESGKVYYNRIRNFQPRILYSDMTSSKSIIAGKTPIAVEVIPGSHMEDGKTRWMSLVNMSTATPEIGSKQTGNSGNATNPATGIYYGQYNTAVEGLENRTNVPSFNEYLEFDWDEIAAMTDEERQAKLNEIKLLDTIQKSDTYTQIPYDQKITDKTNTETYYYLHSEKLLKSDNGTKLFGNYIAVSEGDTDDMDIGNYTHSPFNSDGTPNPLYRSDNADGSKSPLSDFDGKGNTDKLIAAVTADWSGETITNAYAAGNAPAACCCRRFHTEGTNAGDWYQPAMGELGYIMPNLQALNDVLQKLIEAGITAVKIGDYNTWSNDGLGDDLVSSSSYSDTRCWYLYTSSGGCGYNYRDGSINYSRVRAFLSF